MKNKPRNRTLIALKRVDDRAMNAISELTALRVDIDALIRQEELEMKHLKSVK